MKDIGEDLAGLPDSANQIPGPRVQRQVLSHCTVDKAIGKVSLLVRAMFSTLPAPNQR